MYTPPRTLHQRSKSITPKCPKRKSRAEKASVFLTPDELERITKEAEQRAFKQFQANERKAAQALVLNKKSLHESQLSSPSKYSLMTNSQLEKMITDLEVQTTIEQNMCQQLSFQIQSYQKEIAKIAIAIDELTRWINLT